MKRLLLIAALAAATRAQGQAARDTTHAGDSTGTRAAAAAGFTFSGYAEASYQYSTHPSGSMIAGHGYDRFQDQFSLDALDLVADRPADPRTWSAGVHAELLFGQDAAVVQSRGLALGAEGDVPQLYVTLNVPTPNGNGVQVQFGKFATLLGLEVIEDVANPVWSGGSQFIFLEDFTSTGAQVSYRFGPHADAQLRVSNGWDAVEARNAGKTVLGRLGLSPDSTATLSLFAYTGAEEPHDASARRSGAEALLWKQPAPGWNAWLQADYGRETANAALPDPTRDAPWWAFGGWLAHDLTPTVGLAARGDYMADAGGARTSGAFGYPANAGQRVYSCTVTLNLRTWAGALVRPELRYDGSTIAAFGGHRTQLTAGLGVAYLF
jgi:hypothetical protein